MKNAGEIVENFQMADRGILKPAWLLGISEVQIYVNPRLAKTVHVEIFPNRGLKRECFTWNILIVLLGSLKDNQGGFSLRLRL